METIEFLVTGTTPLMTHNPQAMFEPPSGRKKIPSPEEEAEKGAYQTEDGTFAIPAEAFRQSIINAAGQWRIGRYSSKSRMGHIMIESLSDEPSGDPLLLRLFDPMKDMQPITEYAIDKRRVVIVGKGVLRSRPRYESWATRLIIVHDPELVEAAFIAEKVFPDAGTRMGAGDFRPSSGGWFGRYEVELIAP